MSFVYRAYHAAAHQPVQMTTKAGFPTGATYIFARMLKKLTDEHKPEYLVACMEGGPGETFREKLYPEYKANRRGETPNDLVRQFPYINRLIKDYRLPTADFPGYEADDIIGTLARRFYESDPECRIFIVSGDKDMFQLVNDRTFVVNPMKGLLADAAAVEEIVGVPPAQVTDVMALRGDSVDNVPGAPGIGKKGSVDIVRQFGSIEEAILRAGEVKRKSYRESLQNNRAQIELSKQLVTIDRDVPVAVLLDEIKLTELDAEGLKDLYRELEFASLMKSEQLAAVADFAEIVPPLITEAATTMTEEQADATIESIL